jgi:hypothetical protein
VPYQVECHSSCYHTFEFCPWRVVLSAIICDNLCILKFHSSLVPHLRDITACVKRQHPLLEEGAERESTVAKMRGNKTVNLFTCTLCAEYPLMTDVTYVIIRNSLHSGWKHPLATSQITCGIRTHNPHHTSSCIAHCTFSYKYPLRKLRFRFQNVSLLTEHSGTQCSLNSRKLFIEVKGKFFPMIFL